MSELVVKQENNFEVSSLILPGVKAKGAIGDNHLIIEAAFKANNQVQFNTVSIKAADIIHREINVVEARPNTQAIAKDYSDHRTILLPSSQHQTQVLPINNNYSLKEYSAGLLEIIDETFSDNDFIIESKQSLQNNIEFSEITLDETSHLSSLKVRNGQIVSSFTSFSLNSDTAISLEDSLSNIKKQVELDSTLNSETAKAIHDQIYQVFPILNTSSALFELSNRATNIEEILLSRTYSDSPEAAQKAISSLSSSFKHQGQLFQDMMAIICLGIAKTEDGSIAPSTYNLSIGQDNIQLILSEVSGRTVVVNRNEPLKIIHTSNYNDLKTAGLPESVAGVYNTQFNVALFLDHDYRLVHELVGHAAANIFFRNLANPYFKDEGAAYEKAAISVLLDLYKKIEEPATNLAIKDIWSIYNKLLNSPTLALLTASVTSEIKNFKEFFDQHNINSEDLIEKVCTKYFPEIATTEITRVDILRAAAQEVEHLKLSPMELLLIERIGINVFAYNSEMLGGEIFATMFELYFEFNNNSVFKDFFAPIEEVAAESVHQLVLEQLIIPHQLECTGIVDSSNFSYCVEEFLN